jgi:hypothetical protein
MCVKIEVLCLTETSGNTTTTQSYIPDDLNPQRQRVMRILGYERHFWDIFHAFSLECGQHTSF